MTCTFYIQDIVTSFYRDFVVIYRRASQSTADYSTATRLCTSLSKMETPLSADCSWRPGSEFGSVDVSQITLYWMTRLFTLYKCKYVIQFRIHLISRPTQPPTMLSRFVTWKHPSWMSLKMTIKKKKNKRTEKRMNTTNKTTKQNVLHPWTTLEIILRWVAKDN